MAAPSSQKDEQILSDLLAFSDAADAWGKRIKEHIPKSGVAALILFILAKQALLGSTSYGLQDRLAYNQVKKNAAPDKSDEEKIRIILREMAENNQNTQVILLFMGAKKSHQYLDIDERNQKRFAATAKKHKLDAFAKVFLG